MRAKADYEEVILTQSSLIMITSLLYIKIMISSLIMETSNQLPKRERGLVGTVLLVLKHEDLNLNPQCLCEKPGVITCV